MKALKIFVIAMGGLIVFVLVTLFAMGRRPGAGRVTATVEIAAPPDSVMPWLTDAHRLRKWVGWLAEVHGDTTAAAVGRRQDWVMDDGGSDKVTIATEMTAFAPPESMLLKLHVPGMVEGENRYVLEDLGGRTRLTVRGKYRHPNPLIALLEPLGTPAAQAKLQRDLGRLRVRVESAGADSLVPAAPESTVVR